MEEFKLEIYLKETGLPFEISTLSKIDTERIVKTLSEVLNISDHLFQKPSLNFPIVDKYLIKKVPCSESSCKRTIEKLINILDLDNSSFCYLIWDFDSLIDKLDVQTLVKDWDYIWYDTSDEAIILFFPDVNFCILVTDHGYLAHNA